MVLSVSGGYAYGVGTGGARGGCHVQLYRDTVVCTPVGLGGLMGTHTGHDAALHAALR